MRDGRTRLAVRDSIIKTVRLKFKVRREPRPAVFGERAQRLLEILYADELSDCLSIFSKGGTPRPSTLLQDFSALDLKDMTVQVVKNE